MSRKTRLRSYWEDRIPAVESFVLSDAARWINRGAGGKVVSLRTLQRRASDGTLPAWGGSERSLKHYRVHREDLIDWLVEQDLITGSEPPEPRPRREERAAAARPPLRPPRPMTARKRPVTDVQGKLFD